jgi:transcriptional regulator with XRE-family HTH domain
MAKGYEDWHRRVEGPSMNIGQRLMALRATKNFSQADIEKRTGLFRCHISRVENGHTIPNLDTLERWANALGVEVYQLFFEGKGMPEPLSAGSMEPLDRSERELLALYRQVDEADRRFMLDVGRQMAKRAA